MDEDEHEELEAELAAKTAGAGAGADDNDDDDEPTVESLQAELAEARKAQATLKRQLAAEKGKQTKAAKRAPKKDDDDDAPADNAELDAARAENQRLADQLRDLQAEGIARDLKFVDAGDAVRLLDWDEISDPTNRKEVRNALKRLRAEKPHLATAGGGKQEETRGTGAGAGRGRGGQAPTMNDLIRQGVRGR